MLPAAPTASRADPPVDGAASAPETVARPQRGELGHGLDQLVVRVPELVAASTHVLVAHLENGDLDRRADEHGDDLPVDEVVRTGSGEGAGVDGVAGSARQRHLPSDVPQLQV